MKLERADSKEIEGALRPNRPSAFGEIADLKLSETTARLMHRENLSRAEAANFLECLLNPAVTDAQIAAALTSLAVKGETVDELAGMAEAMRNRAVPVRSRHKVFIDTAGTGSSSAKAFNVSTAAAFVIAGAGLPVAKHGSRAATSRCGSADVLQALGVNTAAPPEIVERCLNDHEICFIFAPLFHRATARVARVRRELGVQKGWVVHGGDGLDEITIADRTFVAAASVDRGVETFAISPEDFGLERQSLTEIKAIGPIENAQLIRAILSGEKKGNFAVALDLVIVNAAAALHLAGMAGDLRCAASLARESIDSGNAASKLDALIRETNRSQ